MFLHLGPQNEIDVCSCVCARVCMRVCVCNRLAPLIHTDPKVKMQTLHLFFVTRVCCGVTEDDESLKWLSVSLFNRGDRAKKKFYEMQ